MIRIIWILCAFFAAGAFGLAAYFALRSELVPEPAFIVTPTDMDVGTVPLGDREVAFSVINPADRPRRIIGLAER